MAINPYLDEDNILPPQQNYKITVSNTGQVIAVDHKNLPEGEEGREGSLLSILLSKGVELDHTCGGVVACSTCHIYVTEGGDTAPESSEAEEDQLDFAPAVRDCSRLSCQCVPDGSEDIVVEIPSWKRNEVSEDH
jgi:ferredoxin, 2Fe-2S